MAGIFSRRKKMIPVKITTMDAEMTAITIESDWSGRQLFDAVCRIIGLREIWYFGLQFVNKNGISVWLQMEKLISEQEVPKDENGILHFYFLVKFYPESVEEELIQDITRHLFFLQIKQSILCMELYCQAEAAVLLASYAVQSAFGDANDEVELQLDKLLPQSVIAQFNMSASMWEDRLRKWWYNNVGLSTEDAEMEYLRVAQDLDMYGIQYYPIYNQKDTNLLLGVSAQGIGIYETNNRMSPRPFFPWSEIKNIYFKNKQFTICVVDKSKINFRAQEMSINMSILDLCIGTHNLYLRRRQPDLLEVQQMKIQAREQRQKRLAEQTRFNSERERRIQAETDRDKYKHQVVFLNEQIAAMQEIVRKSDESYRLNAEKLEQESLANSKRASEAEAEMQRVKMSSKMQLNGQHSFENQSPHVSNGNSRSHSTFYAADLGRQCAETTHYISDSANNNQPENSMKESTVSIGDTSNDRHEPMNVDNFGPFTANDDEDFEAESSEVKVQKQNEKSESMNVSGVFTKTMENALNENPRTFDYNNKYFDPDLQQICDELEQARNENNERNRDLRESLMKFREEIEQLKKQDADNDYDRIHANNLQFGIDKYSALRRSGAGTPRKRISAAPSTTCEFPCNDSQCVLASDRCDNVKDCENGKDELDCDYLHSCPTGTFMCKSGECLAFESKCNRTIECADGSDEKACRWTSTVSDLLPTASDYEDEMKHSVLPTVRRTQTKPKPKKRQCAQRNASLYFTNNDVMIYGVAIDGSVPTASQLLLSSISGRIQSLTIDYARNELLYVADRISDQIRIVDQETQSDRVLLEDKYRRFSSIAKDWITGNIYFAEDGVGIGICLEEPKTLRDNVEIQCMQLIKSTSPGDHYRDLIVHPKRGIMMWIHDEPSTSGTLKVAGMDGSAVRQLSGFEHVYAIAFDYEEEKLYISEGNQLEIMNIETLQRTKLKSITPSAMAFYNCELYYINRESNTLMKYVEDGKDRNIMALSGSKFTLAFAGENTTIGHEMSINACEAMNCAEFCTLSERVLESAAYCHCVHCQEATPEQESNVLGVVFGIVAVILFATMFIVFLAFYFRLCPVLCERIDRMLVKENPANESNISVGYNNPAFKS
ncbi:Moesin/ezrin/radixin-like protein 1 [Aphelenchoides besseyi]|nr:Moesin/ezrin/radixin-like protein 1 [Aphelenchoides besseyi]